MNIHPSDLLALQPPGAGLLLTPCPGTRNVALDESLAQLKAAGAQAVITLMPSSEMAVNDVADLGARCAQHDLRWFHCPIEDERAPESDFLAAWEAHGAAVHQLLDAGKVVAVHCKGGSGRTGLMAAQILIERGCASAQAAAMVKTLRPKALSLPVHQEYLLRLVGR